LFQGWSESITDILDHEIAEETKDVICPVKRFGCKGKDIGRYDVKIWNGTSCDVETEKSIEHEGHSNNYH
jgi:hypothetical protein